MAVVPGRGGTIGRNAPLCATAVSAIAVEGTVIVVIVVVVGGIGGVGAGVEKGGRTAVRERVVDGGGEGEVVEVEEREVVVVEIHGRLKLLMAEPVLYF